MVNQNKSGEKLTPQKVEVDAMKDCIRAMEKIHGDPHGNLLNLMMHANSIEYFLTTLQQENVDLNARLKQLDGLINSPELNDFVKGVKLESAHQTERWGLEKEESNHPAHYILVTNKLLGKLTTSMWDGNTDKFKHHCITISAAMHNCHRQINKAGTYINKYFQSHESNKQP